MCQAVPTAPAEHAHPVHYERRRPEETILYPLIQENLETFFAQVEAETGTSLPAFVKDEFEAFLECGRLPHGFLRLRCDDCGHEKLVAFSCYPQRETICSSCSGFGESRRELTPWMIGENAFLQIVSPVKIKKRRRGQPRIRTYCKVILELSQQQSPLPPQHCQTLSKKDISSHLLDKPASNARDSKGHHVVG